MQRIILTAANLIVFFLAAFAKDSLGCPTRCACVKDAVHCVNQGLRSIKDWKLPLEATKLYLSRNELTNAVFSEISKVKNLTVLDLSYNNITELIDRRFSANLEELYLDNNQITFASSDPFGGTEHSLVRLSLRNNLIFKEISIVTFYAHEKLEYLDLSQNRIPSLEDNTVFPPSLKHLNLSYNPIARIYFSTFKLTVNLQSLNLKWIGMKTMKSFYFRKCASLQTLCLGGKNLTEISSQTFRGLPSLEKLKITDSKLTTLPTLVFTGLPNLAVLDLSRNTFDVFEGELFGNDSIGIQELYLEENYGSLAMKQRLFKAFRSVVYLSVKGNNIVSFPEYLNKTLKNLQYLDLSYNNMTTLEELQSLFSNVISLNLSHNKLMTLREKFFDSFPKLHIVDISSNNLSQIEIDWTLTSLKEIAASSNRWTCNCVMNLAFNSNVTFPCHATEKASLDYSTVNAGNVSREFCIYCAEPSQHKGKQFSNIAEHFSECDILTPWSASPSVYIISVSIATLILILAVVAFFVVRSRRNGSKPPDDTRTSRLKAPAVDTSAYHGIEDISGQYQCADVQGMANNDHIYCSIKVSDWGCENQARNRDSTTVLTDNTYIDPNQHTSSQGVMPSGPYCLIPDANPYNGLPAPPPPPDGRNNGALGGDTAYMLDMTAKRKSSYMDIGDFASVARKVGSDDQRRDEHFTRTEALPNM